MAEVVMRWQRQKLRFRSIGFEVEHFDVAEAASSDSDEEPEKRQERRLREETLERCEAELGACLWLDTNRAALKLLEDCHLSYEGVRVLELGAGAGACGIALAWDGAAATICDVDGLLPLMQRNVQLNQLAQPEAQRAAEESEARISKAKTKASEEEEPANNRGLRAKARKAGQRQRASRSQAAAEAEALEASRKGTCIALSVEWGREAVSPTLPASAYELIVVCDCLYENRDSWDSLERIVTRLLKGPEALLVLASAMLRKPFLEAFVSQLVGAGYVVEKREEGGRLGEVTSAILRLPIHPGGEAEPERQPEELEGQPKEADDKSQSAGYPSS